MTIYVWPAEDVIRVVAEVLDIDPVMFDHRRYPRLGLDISQRRQILAYWLRESAGMPSAEVAEVIGYARTQTLHMGDSYVKKLEKGTCGIPHIHLKLKERFSRPPPQTSPSL